MTSYTKGFDSIVAIFGHRHNPYRFAFNGKEKDDELKGAGNSYDFGARIYDSRIGRWLSLDPSMKKYPNQSPYNAFEDDPIYFIDPDGKDSPYEIVGNTITFRPLIIIYGEDATAAKASAMQAEIMKTWNNDGNIAMVNGKVYNLKFNVTVKPFADAKAIDYKAETNLIKMDYLPNKDDEKSYVDGATGNTGTWKTNPKKDANDWDHEFAHLMGIEDQYIEFDILTDFNEHKNGIVTAEGVKDNDVMLYGKNISQKELNALAKYAIENQDKNGKGVLKAKGMPILQEERGKMKKRIREESGGRGEPVPRIDTKK